MPVEIRELIVRAKITTDGSTAAENSELSAEVRADIIATCTSQVLRILKREQER
jgi:hypothetical protein